MEIIFDLLHSMTDLIVGLGVVAILFVIFAESGLLIGFFLPGDSLLFTTGLLVQQGVINFNIHILVMLLFIAAVTGDSVGYAFGRRVGRRLFNRKDTAFFHKDNLKRAEDFYETHGAKTIVIARFVPVVRTFAPIIAGIGHMRYPVFLAYNIIGGFLWAVGITYLGYFAGSWFEARGVDIDTYLLPIIAFIVLASIAPAIYHILKEPEGRAQAKRSLRHITSRFKR